MIRNPALLVLAAVFGLRIVTALSTDGYLGVDGGAYMLSALRVMGDEQTGTDFVRPPLAPGWLLAPFIALFGNVTGFNVYAAVFSMPLLIAGWLIGRSLLGRAGGMAVLVGLSFDTFLTIMFVTGVVPLVGFTFVLVASWGMWRIADPPMKPGSYGQIRLPLPATPTGFFAIVIAIPLIVFTNQTAAGLALIVLPLQWLLLPRKRETLLALMTGGLFALFALPWYFDANPVSGKLTYPGPLLAPHPLTDYQLWIGPLVLAVLFTIRRKLDAKDAPVWVRPAAAVVGTLALMQMFQSHNEVVQNLTFRATYLMVPFGWLLLVYYTGGTLANWYRNVRWAPMAVALSLVVYLGLSAQTFVDQRWLSGFGDGDIVTTARAVPDDAGRVVTNAYSMALYVAVEAQVPVLWTNYLAPPPFYEDDDYQARCTLGWVDGCGPANGVTHVLVDTKWPLDVPLYPLRTPYGAPEARPWAKLADLDWLRLVEKNGTTELYEVLL